MNNSRGFITIATGNRYYQLMAVNLLRSYRFHSKEPLPFAVIAEERNELTSLFDDVIILKDAKRTFMDKFALLKVCPYDETIFLDADSLAYGDLNEYCDVFKDATDFSAIGGSTSAHCSGVCGGGYMYDVEGIWKYGELIKYKVWVHAGVMFIRKSPKLEKLYDDCMDIWSDYDKFTGLRNAGSYDEVTLGIAMPMNDMYPVVEPENLLAFMPCCSWVDADIVNGKLSYRKVNGVIVNGNGVFLHFTTRLTHTPLYQWEVARLQRVIKGEHASLSEVIKSKRLYYLYLKACWCVQTLWKFVIRLPGRMFSRLKRMLNSSKR